MPRKIRVQYPGAIYHVMSRGDRREKIFLDDVDRHDFIKTLAEACQKTGFQVHAYCLMPNQFHLVVETPNGNLVDGMRWLLSAYTIRLNLRAITVVEGTILKVIDGWFGFKVESGTLRVCAYELMIDLATYLRVQHEFRNEHRRIGEIAQRLGLCSKTVAKWVRQPEYAARKGAPRKSKLHIFKPTIQALLKDEGLSAHRIYRLLQAQGYMGKYTILKSYINQERPALPVSAMEFHANLWMHKIVQNAIPLPELQNQLAGKLGSEALNALIAQVRSGTLRARNKAVAILAISKGISINRVKNFLCVKGNTVSKWRFAFERRDIGGLFSARSGKPKKSDGVEYKEAVFSILHSPPLAYGFNRTSWRMEDIVRIMREKGLGLDKEGVRRIIRKAGYRFRQAKQVLTSNDPEYRRKLQEITAILQNLKPDEKFFSVDEFGSFSVKIHGGRCLVGPGEIRTVPQWQKSKGSLIVTAALELSENQITHFYSEKKNTDEMLKLLEILLVKYADQSCVYFSWDAASWHASKRLFKRVAEINSNEYQSAHRVPLVRLAPLPACAQFLNVIESVFSGMAKAIIHNSDYQSVDQCVVAIDRYFLERNEHFRAQPQRAGKKIWGKELVLPVFSPSNNCKDPLYSQGRG